ncbi:MAG: transglutaminase-like domain-containing protein, partial [Nocardioides sp.]|nr:transglutaminase-like domain-containing protein [Nocardioides sp.]
MRTPRPPAHPGLDLFAVAALSVVVLAGLEPSFAGTRWMVVGGFGLTLGLLWAAMMVSLRLGVDLVIESLPIPYVFTAGLLALGSSGLFLGVPDGETLGQVITGTFTSWRDLAETAPPVDSEGTVLLIPYALAMLPSGTALAMAWRSERPTLPVVPLLVALGVVLVLGTHTPLSALGHGLAFGAVALVWVGHRSIRVEGARGAEVTREASGVSLTRVLASAVVVALAAAVVLPLVGAPDDRPRWLVREAVEPYDSAVVRTPLTDFRRFRKGPEESLADEALFTVRGVRPGTRVRLAVLDDYDGTTWSASSDADRDDPLDRFLRVSSTIDNPGRGARRDVRVQMKRTWDLDWLPVVGKVRAFSFYDDSRHTLRDQVRYNRSTSTALLPGGIAKGRSYLLDTRVSQGQLQRDMEPWPEPDMRLWKAAEFLTLPTEVWAAGSLTEMDAVFRIAKRLRQRGRYSDGASGWEREFAPGQSEERLGPGFIDATAQVGNDEQYAATMALMANRLGVPAR